MNAAQQDLVGGDLAFVAHNDAPVANQRSR
jgi:hypothetical protein